MEFKKISLLNPVSLDISINESSHSDLIIFNNSFLFRNNKIRTVKSNKFLCIQEFPIRTNNNIKIALDFGLNNDWNFIPSNHQKYPTLINIEEEIKKELHILGDLVFIPIGIIGPSPEISEKIGIKNLDNLIFIESINILEIDGENILANPNVEDKILIQKFIETINPSNNEIDNYKKGFSTSLKKLRERIRIPLNLPKKPSDLEETFLDKLLSSLANEINIYSSSLTSWKEDKSKIAYFNEVLRISYNFIDEAIKLLRLIISISDLKPILFWMTINSQYQLKEKFNKFDLDGKKKPSLDDYEESIKSARNSTFHNLFKLNNTIEVDLNEVIIKAKKLTFFNEYKSRSLTQNNFEYQDEQLISVLTEFTRTSEKILPYEFWEQNLEVMKTTYELVSDICESLKLLRYSTW